MEHPMNITLRLKPHQLAMIAACRKLETNEDIKIESIRATSTKMTTRVGVMGDLVGSGKTLTILGIIATEPLLIRNRISFNTCSDGLINVQNTHLQHPTNINVIVLPHTIMKQWEHTINTHTTIKYHAIYSNKHNEKYYKDVMEVFKTHNLDDDVPNNWTSLNSDGNPIDFGHTVVLVSSNRFNDFCKYYKSFTGVLAFSRVIYDEIDTINLPNNKELPASFYWFSTSTYDNLLYPNGRTLYFNDEGVYAPDGYFNSEYRNRDYIDGFRNNGFIKSLFVDIKNNVSSFMRKELFLKNHPRFVKDSFRLPKPMINIIRCANPRIAKILQGLISNDVMECINAGDIESAIQKFSCTKVDDTSNIIDIFTRELETTHKNKIIELEMKSQMVYSTPEIKKNIIDKLKNEVSDIKSKIDAVTERVTSSDMCPICCDDTIHNRVVTRCCGNSFCFECLTQALVSNTSHQYKNTCPMCRAKLTTDDIIIESAESKSDGGSKEEALNTKQSQLRNIIADIFSDPTKNHKLLIFSRYDNSFVETQEFLGSKNLNYSRISGTSATIQRTIETYKQSDNMNILLLNSLYSGSGINLENTTHIIVYHNMTSELTQQIIGRAQRPGRKSPLTIYRLMYENELAGMSDISAIC